MGVNANFEQIVNSQVLAGRKIIAIDMNYFKKSIIDKLGYQFYLADEFINRYSSILAEYDLRDVEIEIVVTAAGHIASINEQLEKIVDSFHIYDPVKKSQPNFE